MLSSASTFLKRCAYVYSISNEYNLDWSRAIWYATYKLYISTSGNRDAVIKLISYRNWNNNKTTKFNNVLFSFNNKKYNTITQQLDF